MPIHLEPFWHLSMSYWFDSKLASSDKPNFSEMYGVEYVRVIRLTGRPFFGSLWSFSFGFSFFHLKYERVCAARV